ncbi:MAG: GYD family protein, partial [Candidatus Rokuibacteriota bacterium]
LVLGDYDIVVVTEVPNDETAAKLALGTAMQGNMRTTTMRAFSREEMDKIIRSLP